jgi:hypothetical protein
MSSFLFKGVEEAQYQAISKARDEKKLTLKGMPESALTRMVMSPFAIRATIDSDVSYLQSMMPDSACIMCMYCNSL